LSFFSPFEKYYSITPPLSSNEKNFYPTSSAYIAVERYGDACNGVTYFTVQTRYPELKQVLLSIDKEAES